jgi:hypothetical protein
VKKEGQYLISKAIAQYFFNRCSSSYHHTHNNKKAKENKFVAVIESIDE